MSDSKYSKRRLWVDFENTPRSHSPIEVEEIKLIQYFRFSGTWYQAREINARGPVNSGVGSGRKAAGTSPLTTPGLDISKS